MNRGSSLAKVLILLLVHNLVIVAPTLAAPILPARPDFSDENLSLGGVKRVRLQIHRISKSLQDVGISQRDLDEAFRDELKETGIRIVEDRDAPLAKLILFEVGDSDQPQAMGIGVILAVHQTVKLERLGRRLTIPTYTTTKVFITNEENAAARLEPVLRDVIRHFTRTVEQANRVLQEETE